MTNLEIFFGLMILIQSGILWLNAKKFDVLREIVKLNRAAINSGNEVISKQHNVITAGDNLIKKQEAYIKTLEAQIIIMLGDIPFNKSATNLDNN